MNRILCLDFDGVIFDSQIECLITSFLAYHDKKSNDFDKINISKSFKKLFFQYRYFVRPAWQYKVLWDLIYKEEKITLESFQNGCLMDKKEYKDFESRFFNIRAEIIHHYPDAWFDLNPVYDNVKNNWNKISQYKNSYIVTNKNFDSVNQLLHRYRLDFDEKNIYSKEQGMSKILIIKNLANKLNVKMKDISFCDDSSYYVKQMKDLGCQSFLVKWGYEYFNNPDCHKMNLKILESFNQLFR
tara:strand:+ start:580 stop:1305 length:726 start_codon:yes stop_codon:yes gene_type:complete